MEHFEVRTDPWALARLHQPRDLRDDLVARAFQHIGYVWTRIDGDHIDWERAHVGYTVEVLRSDDGEVLAELDLFHDLSVVTLVSWLDDGTLLCTSYVPDEARLRSFTARLVFHSKARAGYERIVQPEWRPDALLEAHRERLAALARERDSGVARLDLAALFARSLRTQHVAEAMARPALALLMAAAIAVLLAAVGALLAVLFTDVGPWIGVAFLALAGLLAAGPRLRPPVGLVAWLAALPRQPLADLLAEPEVQDKLGDHHPTQGGGVVDAASGGLG